jgi:hypothetical protein
MLIECPHCEARVDAKLHGERSTYDPDNDPCPYRISILECPTCDQTIVALQEQYEEDWGDPERLWPSPKRLISSTIPDTVRISLEEADRCFRVGAYSAAAVMCGRALEGVCVHFKTKNTNLYAGLKELRDTKVIDERLFTWGDELRKVRNLGAHASTEKVPKDDAKDVLNFLHAICDYVFVLSRRFESFIKRRKKSDEET